MAQTAQASIHEKNGSLMAQMAQLAMALLGPLTEPVSERGRKGAKGVMKSRPAINRTNRT
jgi:hypothetical protein